MGKSVIESALNFLYAELNARKRNALKCAARENAAPLTSLNRPKDFSFVIHHCVRECMPVNVPSKCTCVISLFLIDRKDAMTHD